MTVVFTSLVLYINRVINYLTKDITTIEQGYIIHGTNCSGGFGSGVAGAIKRKWPVVYEQFMKHGKGPHLLGSIDFVRIDDFLVVINLYSQDQYGYDGKKYASPQAIETGLFHFLEILSSTDDETDVYLPKIGCGLGGLSWEHDVLPIINKVCEKYPHITFNICEI